MNNKVVISRSPPKTDDEKSHNAALENKQYIMRSLAAARDDRRNARDDGKGARDDKKKKIPLLIKTRNGKELG